jgi:hypothetical protein
MSFNRPAARCRISTEAASLQVGGHEPFAQAGGRTSDELNEAHAQMLCTRSNALQVGTES